jgi:hypothetical protein
MLPLPPFRITPKRTRRSWIQRLDAYTLWAFNPQPPLVARPLADERTREDQIG